MFETLGKGAESAETPSRTLISRKRSLLTPPPAFPTNISVAFSSQGPGRWQLHGPQCNLSARHAFGARHDILRPLELPRQ